jgi:flagellar biosynthesis protein FlhG
LENRVLANSSGVLPNSAASAGQVISIAGGKGGVGKTVITAAMGIALAKSGKKTVVFDADFGGANLHQAFGIITPPITIRDFICRNIVDINDILLETSIPGLYLIAGSAGTLGVANLKFYLKQKILSHVRRVDAEYVLLDLGADNSFDQLDFFNSADLKIIVVTPEPLAIQDGYNFLKLSLYRHLCRLFYDNKRVLEIFKIYFLPEDAGISFSIQSLIQKISSLGDVIYHRWKKTIEEYRPSLIVNMIENKQDYRECLALQIAAREILNIRFDTFEYVQYDDTIRRAIKMMRPDLLMTTDGLASADLRRSVEQMILTPVKDQNILKEPRLGHLDRGYPLYPFDEVICSVKCALWGKCSVQNGGYPCRIKAVGYVNQK